MIDRLDPQEASLYNMIDKLNEVIDLINANEITTVDFASKVLKSFTQRQKILSEKNKRNI